jgi:hypothetical protein
MFQQRRVYMLTGDQQQYAPLKLTELKSTKLRLRSTHTALFTYLNDFSWIDSLASARTCRIYTYAK